MKSMSGKIVAWLNDVARDYVYGTYKHSKLMRITRIALLIAIATVVGDSYARYMVPVPTPVESSGTFLDGYMHRYWFDVGAVAFIVVVMLTCRLFRALCAAYVRRLDMDDAILAGDAGVKNKPSFSSGNTDSVNGDYVSAVDSSEDTISESEGGDA